MKNGTFTAMGAGIHMNNVLANSKFLKAYANAAVNGWNSMHQAWSGFNGILHKPTIWISEKNTNQPLLHVGPVTLTGISCSSGIEASLPAQPLLDSAGSEINDDRKPMYDWRREYDSLERRYDILRSPSIYAKMDDERIINGPTRDASWEQHNLCYRKKERLLERMESKCFEKKYEA